jgi:predicted Zn-dependent protease
MISARGTLIGFALAQLAAAPAAGQSPFPLPFPTLPFPTLPFPTLPFPTLPVPTLPFIAPPLPDVPADSPRVRAISAKFGGRLDGAQATLVADAMAKVSAITRPVAPPSGFRVTLLDSPVVNAMAIGEGNIFITRQILALTNNEEELIGVLGHEAGHVMARHSTIGAVPERVERGGSSLLGLVSPDLAAAAGLGGTLVVRFFSRAMEHQSDVTGTKVLADMGLDPMGMYRAIAMLEADESLDRLIHGTPKPGVLDDFLRTHPVSTQRLQLISAAARMAPRNPPQVGAAMAPAAYVRRLDGLVFDDGRSEGAVDGDLFRHGPMKLEVTAPPGFKLRNTPDALIVNGPNGASAVLAAKPAADDLQTAFAAIWKAEFGKLAAAPTPQLRTIAGLPATEGKLQVKGSTGQVNVVLTVVRWPDAGLITLLSVDPGGGAETALATLRNTVRQLSAAEAEAVPVRQIKVVEATPRDSIAALSTRMAYRDNAEARFRTLNGLPTTATKLAPGPVKLVVWSNGTGLSR